MRRHTAVLGNGLRGEIHCGAPQLLDTGDVLVQAAEIGAFADLVIVGSALLKCLDSDGADMPGDLARLRALAGELAEGVDRSRR